MTKTLAGKMNRNRTKRRLRVAIGQSRLGKILLAATDRGIAALYFGKRAAPLLAELEKDKPGFSIRRDDAALAEKMRMIISYAEGRARKPRYALDLEGTPFEHRVWRALGRIPEGESRSYGDIAKEVGKPGAARAVGRACARNPVSLLVPCHRAVAADGGLGGYRWGLKVKRALLAHERQTIG